jgi:hypothetical protein
LKRPPKQPVEMKVAPEASKVATLTVTIEVTVNPPDEALRSEILEELHKGLEHLTKAVSLCGGSLRRAKLK